MEGLLLARALDPLRARLPVERTSWRFDGPHASVLPLRDGDALWILDRPPNPRIELRDDLPSGPGAPRTTFQAQLAARASGPLERVEQPGLDRVARFRFGAAHGFVATEPVVLIAELAGRNGNLILVSDDGTVLGAAREVGPETNRYRQIRPGLPYRPPPPYDKADPRELDDAALARILSGTRPKRAKQLLDGIGPDLTRAAVRLSGVPEDAELTGDALDAFVHGLRRVITDPFGAAREALDLPDVAALHRRERRETDLKAVRRDLEDRLARVRKRIQDGEKAVRASEESDRLRREADLLLAYAHAVPRGADRAVLCDFDGGETTVVLDPSKSVAANAEARYATARRREDRAERAIAREPELVREREELEHALGQLDELDDATLRRRAQELERRPERARRTAPGASYPGPHGFEVLVGRSARENDAITFRVARSRDLWLHVQGWHGAHVVIRSGGREVPFDTVVFAARLAAGHSKASGGDNVPVDVTERKNVWKVKGGPPGAVQYAHQKTVYVTPSRDPTAEERAAARS